MKGQQPEPCTTICAGRIPGGLSWLACREGEHGGVASALRLTSWPTATQRAGLPAGPSLAEGCPALMEGLALRISYCPLSATVPTTSAAS
jgi:hypothetical protein